MQKIFSVLIGQFKQFYGSLPPLKRNAIFVSSIIAMVGFAVVIMMLTKQDYVPLFTNVAPDQMPLIIDNLRQKNIGFRLGDDGQSVLVPRDVLPATQMAVMADLGSSKTGNLGLELFEKQDFGVTSFAQKVTYQRAIQGELVRAINTLSSVKQSKVLLTLPTKKTFLEESAAPSASVVVEMHAGKSLNQDQVRGITHLVASAVEGMDPTKVIVVDEKGKILSKNYDADGALSSELMDLRKKYEEELEGRIDSLLSRVAGAGKVSVRVSAVLNPRTTSSVEETVDAEATAIRSQVTEEESLDGSRTSPTGVPGSRANIPGAAESGQVGLQQNVKKELKTTNYDVPKTVKNIREAAGELQKISVAVLVDGITKTTTAEDGTSKSDWAPRSDQEMTKYESIVKSAIGFDAKRGDVVRIENIQFQKEEFEDALGDLEALELGKIKRSLLFWSFFGGVLALIFFLVVKPFMRWITDSFQDSVEDMLPRTIEELEELQSGDNTLPGMSGALPVLEESIDPNKAESELLKERIMGIMESDIEKTSAAFNMWIARREN